MDSPHLSFSDFFSPLSPPNFDCNIHLVTPQSPVSSPPGFFMLPSDQTDEPQNNYNNYNQSFTPERHNPEELTNIPEFNTRYFATVEDPPVNKNDESGINFACLECSKSFTNKRNLQRHNREKHNATTHHPCLICPKRFPRKSKLALHRYTHLSKTQLVDLNVVFLECRQCPKIFFEQAAYRRHVSSHLRKNYSCHLCSAKYTQNYNLQRHLKRIHSDSTFLPVEE